MRILVNGGAGFIGSHLSEALLRRGDKVVVLDDLSTGSLANLERIVGHPGMEFVHGSVLDSDLVSDISKRCDAVVHLAAAVGVFQIMSAPGRSLMDNTTGTTNVLMAATRWHRRTVIASSSEIYGKNPDLPLNENANRVLPSTEIIRWSYSTGKAVEEHLAFASAFEHGLPVSVVRLFNTVGPRQSPAYGMVVPRFVRQALAGEDLTVFGDGSQTRCFGYVDDVVDGLLRVLDRPEAIGTAFNLGSAEEISILSLAKRTIRAAGSSSRIGLVSYDNAYGPGYDDTERRVPDLAKARLLLGYQPRWSIDSILAAVIADMLGKPIPSPAAMLAGSVSEAAPDGIDVAPPTPIQGEHLDGLVPHGCELTSFVVDPPPVINGNGNAHANGNGNGHANGNGDGHDRTFESDGNADQIQHHAPLISVVVPVYNEERSVAEAVRRMRAQDIDMELVVVNDGSTDGTSRRLAEVADLIDTLVELPQNSGKGAAVRAGIAASKCEVIVLQDADLELDASSIAELVAPILAGTADYSAGSRVHAGNSPYMSGRQWWGNRMVSLAVLGLYGARIEDVATAAKAFRRDLISLLDLESSRFELESEIVVKMVRCKARIVEFPITFRPRASADGKKVRLSDGIDAMRTLLKYRFWSPPRQAIERTIAGERRLPTKKHKQPTTDKHPTNHKHPTKRHERAKTSRLPAPGDHRRREQKVVSNAGRRPPPLSMIGERPQLPATGPKESPALVLEPDPVFLSSQLASVPSDVR